MSERVRPEHPTLGVVYVDATGRKLKVIAVDLGNGRGRQVQGLLHSDARSGGWPYACDLPTWQAVWRDRRPPTPVSEQSLV